MLCSAFHVWGGGEGTASLGGAETKEGGRGTCLGGLLWQLAADSISRTVLSAAQGGGAAGAAVRLAAALHAALSQPCHGLGTSGLLHDNLASGAILLGQQPRGGWPGMFCPASPLFRPSPWNGQAAPLCRPFLFEALSCRAGPARKKPVY